MYSLSPVHISNNVEATLSNAIGLSHDSFDNVECCFDEVERCFDIVAGVDGAVKVRVVIGLPSNSKPY